MATSLHLYKTQLLSSSLFIISPSSTPFPKSSSLHLSSSLTFPSLHSSTSSTRHQRRFKFRSSGLWKLSETELVPFPSDLKAVESEFPSGSGVYGVYDKNGALQFVGLARNIAAALAMHSKLGPDLCAWVKVGLVDGTPPDRTVLTDAWKSWIEEHIELTGKVPPGNEKGNNTWFRQPQQKPNLRLTPGRHVQLTVPLEDLIDRLVKEKEVVAFIKGSRSAPQCGFSQRVVGILESHGVDFECVDVLDEEYNSGLRETLKNYSNWPTFPQVFFKGELLGGCDIISSMAEKGELATLFKK